MTADFCFSLFLLYRQDNVLYCNLYSIFPLKTLLSRSCEGFERCRQGSSIPLPRSAAPASQKEIDSNELNVAVHFCRWNICASRTDGRTGDSAAGGQGTERHFEAAAATFRQSDDFRDKERRNGTVCRGLCAVS